MVAAARPSSRPALHEQIKSLQPAFGRPSPAAQGFIRRQPRRRAAAGFAATAATVTMAASAAINLPISGNELPPGPEPVAGSTVTLSTPQL